MFLGSIQNVPISIRLFSQRAPLQRAWLLHKEHGFLHLLSNPLTGTGRLPLGAPKPSLYAEQALLPQPLLPGPMLQPSTVLLALHWTCSSLSMPFFSVQMQNNDTVHISLPNNPTDTSS